MSQLFPFGEDQPAYPVRVLNEREARAATDGYELALRVWPSRRFRR